MSDGKKRCTCAYNTDTGCVEWCDDCMDAGDHVREPTASDKNPKVVKHGGSVPKIPDAPDTRHAEARQPACPICLGEKSVGQSDEGTLAACPNCQPAPEPTVLPWMEALSDDLYDYFVMGGGQPGDQSAIDAISRHAPDVPAVRDAAVEELVRMAENAEMWLQNSIPVGGMPMLHAAIARVKGTKEDDHAD